METSNSARIDPPTFSEATTLRHRDGFALSTALHKRGARCTRCADETTLDFAGRKRR
jgi:hypothetical protein